jgi:hypothetical protein
LHTWLHDSALIGLSKHSADVFAEAEEHTVQITRRDGVARPTTETEYDIRFASAGARKGRRDLAATIRSPMADDWDFFQPEAHAATQSCERPVSHSHQSSRAAAWTSSATSFRALGTHF